MMMTHLKNWKKCGDVAVAADLVLILIFDVVVLLKHMSAVMTMVMMIAFVGAVAAVVDSDVDADSAQTFWVLAIALYQA